MTDDLLHLCRQGVLTESVDGRDTTEYSSAGNRSLVLFDRGDEIVVQAGDEGIEVAVGSY